MRAVEVTFALVDGKWSAESAELPEWMAVGDTFTDAMKLASEGLEFFLAGAVRVVPVVVGTSSVWPVEPSPGLTENAGPAVVSRAA
jgi:predicted RNase H-like HicB family nuclease